MRLLSKHFLLPYVSAKLCYQLSLKRIILFYIIIFQLILRNLLLIERNGNFLQIKVNTIAV